MLATLCGVPHSPLRVVAHPARVWGRSGHLRPFAEGALACLPYIPAGQPWSPDPVQVAKRRDLRQSHLVCSVDPPGCTDIDDALSYKRLENGNMQFGVHIADVTAFVHHGSALDLEARQRSTTVYLVDRRMDMLPSLLSEVLCSLRSGTSVCSAPCASALVFTNPSRC